MSAYFAYLAEMIKAFFRDLGRFFYKGIVTPWQDVGQNFKNYNSIFSEYHGEFHFVGWLFFILFLLFFIALIGAFVFGIFILVRKYVRFIKRELDKDELRRKVERLNYELYTATQEKDKILNLKTAYMGLKPADETVDQEALNNIDSRFPKLTLVDQNY